MNLFILATCLNRSLIGNTLLVFKTIRVGFPSAVIKVCGNALDNYSGAMVERAAINAGAEFYNFNEVSHGAWIESLILNEAEHFWICDTDITFHDKVENWFNGSDKLFAGRYEPEFYEPWTQSQHVARLHPSLMWFNPVPLRAAMREWPGKHPFFRSVEKPLIRWSFVPVHGDIAFYDTCAGLHHALGGEAFSEEQNRCFSHRFAGTYADLIGSSEDQLKMHEAICKTSRPQELDYGKRS